MGARRLLPESSLYIAITLEDTSIRGSGSTFVTGEEEGGDSGSTILACVVLRVDESYV